MILIDEGGAAANPATEGQNVLRSIYRFTLESRKTEDILHNATSMVVSHNGEKLLYRKGDAYLIAAGANLTPTAADAAPGNLYM